MLFINTCRNILLPESNVPETKICDVSFKSIILHFPYASFPSATVKLDVLFLNSSLSIISLNSTSSLFFL